MSMQIKKIDIVLIILTLVVLLFLIRSHWTILIKVPISIILALVILHWKLFPYQNQIEGKYKKVFNTINSILSPIISCLSFLPKIKLGANLFLEIKHLFIAIILILTLIIL